jgi:heme A synthase
VAVVSFVVAGALVVLAWSALKLYSIGVRASDSGTQVVQTPVEWWWLLGSFIVLTVSAVALGVLVERRSKR